ncbi:hypothetical protein BGZ93_007838 [Podila epicladia]|nr:hypothetical protein BGZ93_007838 [Podila epicladia]
MDIIEERSRNAQMPAPTREPTVIEMINGGVASTYPSSITTQKPPQNGSPSPSSPWPCRMATLLTPHRRMCILEFPALKYRRQDLEAKIKDFESILNKL